LESSESYKLVTIKLKHNGVVLRHEKPGSEIKSKMFEVKEGDFILSGIDARNGAFGIVPKDLDGAIVTNDFWYFDIDESIVDKHFFLELTTTLWFDEICRKGSDGTTQRIRLQKNKFFNHEIFLPELDEQREFIEIFKRLKNTNNTLSDELTHQQALLKKLRQQILQEAIEGKLTIEFRMKKDEQLRIWNDELRSATDPETIRHLKLKIRNCSESAASLLRRIKAEKEQLIKDKKIKKQKALPPITDEEKPFDLPDGWVWCRVGVLLNKFSTGPFGSMLHKSDYVPNGIPLVNPANIVNGAIVPSAKMMIDQETRKRLSKYILKTGEFVIARRGDLSKCAIISEHEDGWLCGTGSFFIQPSEFIEKNLFLKVYRSSFFQKQLADTSIGQTMANLNQKILNNSLFPLPPKFEQKAIVSKVEELLAVCDQLEAQISQNQTHAEQLMQAVLKEAFQHDETALC